MNMFMLSNRAQWGFLVGSAAVGVPTVLLVVLTDARGSGPAWMAALTAALVGGGWAALLSLQNKPPTLWRAVRLGASAWMATTFVFSLLSFYLLPYLIYTLPLSALIGAGLGATAGGLLRWADIGVAPPVRYVRPRRMGR